MNYADIIRINYPDYIVTHAGDGTNYDVLEWNIYNPMPNPIPKATLDAEISAAVAAGAGELADLTTSGEQELYAISNLDESAGLIRKLAHASYVLDSNVYITGITSTNVTNALGFTPYDAANPQVYTTKTYVDSLVSAGVVWVSPIHAFNFIGTASAPPSGTPHENENYIIMAGGNTGVWSAFAPGDRVSYVGGTWVWREYAHAGCRLGINFDKTAGSLYGDAAGKQDYIGEITGGNATDGYTWTWTAPTNHMSTFNNLSTSTKFGQAYTYDATAGNWIPFATNTVIGGNAITINGQTVNVDYGPGTQIYNDTIAVLPYPGGGLMNTLDGTTSSDNKEAYLSLTKVGTAGTYQSVTIDAHGRVTSGSNPTTLSGYGITDAVRTSTLGTALGVATLDSSSKLTATQLPAHNQDWSTITNTPNTVVGYGITDAVSTSQLGIASGIATLDGSGKLTTAQIPTSLTGGLNYQGTWNASTNTPTLANGVGTKGYYYKVSVAGTTNIDGFANWTVGDMIVYNGTAWDAIQGGSSDVTSVFGRVGAVTATLASADFANQGTATTFLRGNAAGNPVWSAINLATMVTGTLPMSATGALTGDLTKPSGGSVTTLATVNVNTGSFGSASAVPVITVNGKGLITAVSTATIPTAITLTGDVTATGAVNGTTTTTLADTAVVAGTYGSATQVPQFIVDSKGRLTSAGNINIPNTVGITGDGTATITTGSSGALTLATVNTNVGTFGDGGHVAQVIVNAKGLVTAAANVNITPAAIGAIDTNQLGVASGVATLDAGGQLNIAQDPEYTGDVTKAAGSSVTTLSNTGVTAGTYTKVTVDAKGRATVGEALSSADVTTALGYTPAASSASSGMVLVASGVTGATTGTTQIPFDNSTPKNTEGTQIWTVTLTPNSTNSKFIIDQDFFVDTGVSNRNVTFAVFRDTTCIRASAVNITTAGRIENMCIHVVDAPATAAAVTYSLRVGVSASSTSWFLNQQSGNQLYGGAGASDYTILEVL
jgi:hypothetical protein